MGDDLADPSGAKRDMLSIVAGAMLGGGAGAAKTIKSLESVVGKVASQAETGIVWGKSIQAQGLPWENYLAKLYSAESRLPQNFKTFDFFDKTSGVAVSAKTLNTLTDPKLAKPSQVYASVKSYVDSAVNFGQYELLGTKLDAAQISSRTIELAVPQATTSAQWQQLQKAIEYGASKGVTVNLTGIK